MKTSESSVIYT